MAAEVLHHPHQHHPQQSSSSPGPSVPPGGGANLYPLEPPLHRHNNNNNNSSSHNTNDHNNNAPPLPFHPHSPNENNVDPRHQHHHHDNNNNGGHGPTAADFAADGNNDLDEPRLVANRDGTVEDWNHITKPGTHDVLLGRGGGTNNHSGNVKFRQLVNEHKMAYLACSKVEKPKVAREVVAIWRKMSPPGRFLARKDETKRGPGSVKANDNVWYEVGDKKAREKASQCLRERTPDVLPYIKHLRDQQNAVTEYGIMQMQHQGPPASSPTSGGYGAGGYPPAHHHHHQHHFPHHMPQPEYHAPTHHPHHMTAQRRNSAPQPLPHLYPHAPQSSSGYGGVGGGGGRRASTNSIYEDEYQQQMMLMHQTMMQQQHSPYMLQHQHLPQHGYEQQPPHSQGPPHLQPSHSEDTTTTAGGGDHDVAVGNKNTNINTTSTGKKRVSPDRAISLMSFTPMDGAAAHQNNDHDPQHELSLEDYRQQLEEYIANCQAEDGATGNRLGTAGAAADDDNDGNDSDMEDDWERERERAMQQQKSTFKKQHSQRGVGRNVSGLSYISNKSAGQMSLVSGLASFDARDAKMGMARSVCSNLSLMSELTDLSQNIDNLSIYDD